MPFNTDINYVGVNKVRVKYALSNRFNLRLALQYNHNSNHKDLNEKQVNSFEAFFQSDYTNKEVNYAIIPGVEYVFFRGARISPYIGIDPIFAVRKTSAEVYLRTEMLIGTTPDVFFEFVTLISNYKLDGLQYAEMVDIGVDRFSYSTSFVNPSFKLFGVQIPLGFNVNVYKNLYVGLEITLYYYNTVASKAHQFGNETLILDSGERVDQVIDRKIIGKKIKSFGILYDNSVRVGIRF